MKRIQVLILTISLVTAMAMAAETNVSSVNVVGYTKVSVPSNGLTLVALNLESISGANMCISNLVGNQLPNGSYAFIWDRGGVQGSYINCSKSSRSGWTPGTNILHRGDAFWLYVPGSVATAAQYEVVLSGEVPDSTLESTTTVDNIRSVDAVGYPYPTDTLWTNTTLAKGAPVGSYVHVWNGAAYDTYNKGARSGWTTPAGFVLRMGQAFWFQTVAATNWTEIVPYNLH